MPWMLAQDFQFDPALIMWLLFAAVSVIGGILGNMKKDKEQERRGQGPTQQRPPRPARPRGEETERMPSVPHRPQPPRAPSPERPTLRTPTPPQPPTRARPTQKPLPKGGPRPVKLEPVERRTPIPTPGSAPDRPIDLQRRRPPRPIDLQPTPERPDRRPQPADQRGYAQTKRAPQPARGDKPRSRADEPLNAGLDLSVEVKSHMERQVVPRARRAGVSPQRVRALLHGHNSIRDAIVLSEILAPPVGLRDNHPR